jgi:hypothetical protein
MMIFHISDPLPYKLVILSELTEILTLAFLISTRTLNIPTVFALSLLQNCTIFWNIDVCEI